MADVLDVTENRRSLPRRQLRLITVMKLLLRLHLKKLLNLRQQLIELSSLLLVVAHGDVT